MRWWHVVVLVPGTVGLVRSPSFAARYPSSVLHLPSPVSPPQQTLPPSYQVAQLACVAFLEQVKTAVDARRAMESWKESGQRTGRLIVTTTPNDRGIGFEAWYDSLVISYDGREGPVRPDTDGLIGGRWRGIMAPHGEALLEERPFMPPEVHSVSDLSDALLDFFPPLPTAALRPGSTWTDSLGLEIERLRDSAASGETVERYRWRISTEAGPEQIGGDSTARLRQSIKDAGVLSWSRARGPLGWRREIVVEAQVGAVRGPRSPVQSRVTQEISVRRVPHTGNCR